MDWTLGWGVGISGDYLLLLHYLKAFMVYYREHNGPYCILMFLYKSKIVMWIGSDFYVNLICA